MNEHLLKEIERYADSAHADQMRKYANERYIVHPVRVMNICREITEDPSILAAALLHDVLEDTPVTPQEMQQYLWTIMEKK